MARNARKLYNGFQNDSLLDHKTQRSSQFPLYRGPSQFSFDYSKKRWQDF